MRQSKTEHVQPKCERFGVENVLKRKVALSTQPSQAGR
jgi:hypothetical protein